MTVSKTKLGGVLLAVSIALPPVAEALQTGNWAPALQPILQALGAVLAIFGVRNALGTLGQPPAAGQ